MQASASVITVILNSLANLYKAQSIAYFPGFMLARLIIIVRPPPPTVFGVALAVVHAKNIARRVIPVDLNVVGHYNPIPCIVQIGSRSFESAGCRWFSRASTHLAKMFSSRRFYESVYGVIGVV
jgi:hypothetical protein